MSRSPRIDRSRRIVALIPALVGVVWILQGVGALPGSFMTGDMAWAWIGIGLVAAALVYAAWPRLRRR
jgi:hypothetical protein